MITVKQVNLTEPNWAVIDTGGDTRIVDMFYSEHAAHAYATALWARTAIQIGG